MNSCEIIVMRDVLRYLLESDGSWLDEPVGVELITKPGDDKPTLLSIQLLEDSCYFADFT